MKQWFQKPYAPLVVAALWWVLPIRFLLLPFDWLYVHFHELWHAVAALATGATSSFIRINLDASGVTVSNGGFLLIVAAAGYVGTTVLGAWIIVAARTDKGARLTAQILAGVLGLALVLFVRSLVGWVSGVIWLGALVWASKAPAVWVRWVVSMVGTILCLASLEAVFSIFGLTRAMTENDAVILERATGIPALLSASVWSLISIGAVVWAGRMTMVKGRA